VIGDTMTCRPIENVEKVVVEREISRDFLFLSGESSAKAELLKFST
jgi:hypothetical protein